MNASSILLICPSVPAWRRFGIICLDRKFHDGLSKYLEYWPGKIIVALRVVEIEDIPAFGSVNLADAGEGFSLLVLGQNELLSEQHLKGVDVVLASADSHMNLHVAGLCESQDIVCIYDIEYTLLSRMQMLRYEMAPVLKKLKTAIWMLHNERRIIRAMKKARSIQANGIPAYKRYAKYVRQPLLYFDSRLTQDMLISAEALNDRLGGLNSGKPLRLVFSGRLIRAKGADALLDLAVELDNLNVPYEMHIFGAGDMEPNLRIRASQLPGKGAVLVHGAVDFERALLPFVKEKADLFICCHRQGDPSCTYLETLGCGIPIVGFGNEAFRGILETADVGWQAPLNDIEGLAKLIVGLAIDRAEIAKKSYAALEFARSHSFENVFRSRMEHCAMQ